MPREFLEAGRIDAAHGVKGLVKARSWCDSPRVLASLRTVYLNPPAFEAKRILRGAVSGDSVILALEGVVTREQAEALRGAVLYLRRGDLKLPEGSYFRADLLGLRAVDSDTGEDYGAVSEILETGANDVYVLTKEGQTAERLVPAIPEVIEKVDIEGGKIYIRPLKGLFDA